jgi:hypothetical protein
MAMSGPTDRDCCVFARSVLRLAYGAEVVDQVAVARWHLVVPPSGPWEPVLAAGEAGLALDITGAPQAPTRQRGRWHLMQGWRATPLAPGSSGHTWLWLDLGDGWGELLDSTRSRGARHAGLQWWDEYASQYRGGIASGSLRRP